jgi:hypothetical protein
MSDNLVLELLRVIRGDIRVLSNETREVKHRRTSLEMGVGAFGGILQRFSSNRPDQVCAPIR